MEYLKFCPSSLLSITLVISEQLTKASNHFDSLLFYTLLWNSYLIMQLSVSYAILPMQQSPSDLSLWMKSLICSYELALSGKQIST